MVTSHEPPIARHLARILVIFSMVFAAIAAHAQQEEEPEPEVRPLEVRDPLLTPPPPPRRVLGDWQEALGMVSARSTDLILAVQDVERARGAWREALGRALLTVTATGTATHHLLRSEAQ